MKSKIARIFSILLLAIGLSFATLIPSSSVFAEPADDTESSIELNSTDTSEPAENIADSDSATNNEEGTSATDTTEENAATCSNQTGGLSWFVCPSSGLIASAIDALYAAIEDLLEISPISMSSDSPVYLVWQYVRNLTNLVFIIFLFIVIYSQLTGIGLNNYGVKRILPRLIIAVILVNLSFIICTLAVDVSNIIGSSLRDFFTGIEEQIIASSGAVDMANFSLSKVLSFIIAGLSITGVVISATGGMSYLFWLFLIVLIGAIVAVVSGLITIAARQALVALLIMISPLAFVAYLLPNTEKWFGQWKQLLYRMLVFYPMFSFLFGASQLVGYTLIASAIKDGNDLGVIFGIAVQIFPLFFSWSLMKMSGTVLGSLNTGLRKLASPLQRGLTGWATSHAERNRAYHLANSTASGARLRQYLDYRRQLRELDTENSTNIRKDKAMEHALRTASSSRGHDKNGNLVWDERANRYTINAKRASLHQTRATTAKANLQNTLSGYDRYFSGAAAARLGKSHAEAFKDAKTQDFLTANEAEADQQWLLNEFLNAAGDRDSYEFNRLIKSAAGGLRHLGEDSIMGQVIAGNVAIENRRRAEARVMITKFGIDKPSFRGMNFNHRYINDDGIATDENGRKIEDSQGNLLPGEHYTPWHQYIGVHKKTGAEITKEEYDNLSDAEKSQYNQVRYMDIYDKGTGKTVQRVHFDDAGYMKEMLRDDIAIGDPITTRYLTEIYARQKDDGSGIETGLLWKYRSTVAAAVNDTGYKQHFGPATAMLIAQANNGYIKGRGEFNIAMIDSFNKSAKPGPILQNDAIFIRLWADMLNSVSIPDTGEANTFSWFFPDKSIIGSLNINGKKLKGLELITNEDGNPMWKEIDAANMKQIFATDPDRALSLRKNFIKHSMLPQMARKLINTIDRRIPQEVLANQKIDTLEALERLELTLDQLGRTSVDPDVPFENKLDGKNIFDSKDPGYIQLMARDTKKAIQAKLEGRDPESSGANTSSSQPRYDNNDLQISSSVLRRLAEMLDRANTHEESVKTATSTAALINTLSDFLNDDTTELYSCISAIETLVLPNLDTTDPRYDEVNSIIAKYQSMMPPNTTQDSIDAKDNLCHELIDYLEQYGYDD